jgi:hypothetical protein
MLLWLAFILCTSAIVYDDVHRVKRAEKKPMLLAWDSAGIVAV